VKFIQTLPLLSRKQFLSPFTVLFANFYVINFIIVISNFCGFASKTGETKIDDGFTENLMLVSVCKWITECH